jgi:hypothetical protein
MAQRKTYPKVPKFPGMDVDTSSQPKPPPDDKPNKFKSTPTVSSQATTII